MSPASRSKPKDKSAGKAAKEQQKSSSKASAPGTTGNGAPASAYNPLHGTFHTLDTVPSISSPPHNNGRFRNIDETDEQSGSSVGTGAEYDSVSNNDSCSGESEDQKDKIPTIAVQQESIPGSDNEKREKIRQKNERKHQRQRERRAQELHDKCRGYLMSGKLDALSQQLVAMGFTSERATMALILNDGRIEDSVAWLFEGGEETAQHKNSNLESGNLKIDISVELSQISELQTKYNCSKQDVERAVVACEGDLEKASENLRAQKQQEPVASPQKAENNYAGNRVLVNSRGKIAVSVPQNMVNPPAKALGAIIIQQRRDEREFNYTKAAAPATGAASPESTNRNFQSLRKSQPKSERPRPPQVATQAEKRWPSGGGSSSSFSYSLTPPLQGSAPPLSKVEARYVVAGSDGKNPHTGGVREPVSMMQRPQSINSKQISPSAATNISTSPPRTATGWYRLNSVPSVDIMKSNGEGPSNAPSTRGINASNLSVQQFYIQSLQYQQQLVSNPVADSFGAGSWGTSWNTTGTGAHSPTSSLSVPPPLGLFPGWGTTGSSGSTSPVDWSTVGSMPQCDYTNIDWTLEATSSSKYPKTWSYDLASLVNSSRMYESWSLGNTQAGLSKPPTMAMRSARSNGGGACLAEEFQQEGVAKTTETASGTSQQQGSHEWTSPFAGKDLFSLPRQFVTSPSL